MKIFSVNPLHINFKCTSCNSIIGIDSEDLNLSYLKLNDKLEKNDLLVFDTDIILIGLCKKCRGDKNGKTN